jgi:hypothetical protein
MSNPYQPIVDKLVIDMGQKRFVGNNSPLFTHAYLTLGGCQEFSLAPSLSPLSNENEIATHSARISRVRRSRICFGTPMINIPKNRSATGDGPGHCIEPGAGRPWATTLRHRDRDHGDVLAGNDGISQKH